MPDLIEENEALKKQHLQLMIQNSMLTQQLQSTLSKNNTLMQDYQKNTLFMKEYVEGTNEVVKKLTKLIPNQAKVRAWVREENDDERKKYQNMRDETVLAMGNLTMAANKAAKELL